MVHSLAKTLSVLFLSVLFAVILSFLVAIGIDATGVNEIDSLAGVIKLSNFAFGWFIYAIPFAIIGFKIYPKPKKKN